MVKNINEFLTIVIPCKNEGLTIQKTISLLNRQAGIEGTKVIIADSSNDDYHTLNCIKSSESNNLSIKIIEGGFPSIARNNGAKLADTKYVLFLDSDIFIKDKNLINDLLIKVEERDGHLLTVKIRTENKKYNSIYLLLDFVIFITQISTPFAVGGFMLFNKKIFNDLGGFNVKDKFAEDYHLSSKVNPKRFFIINKKVYTLSRRFEKKGVWYMIKITIKSYLNKNNNDFFTKEHNYWS